jgi:hypothetical protein
MAWERRGAARYYYGAVWAGRTEKRYFGRGPAGELAAQLDEQAREGREARAGVLRAEAARLAPPEAALRALDDASDLMIRAALTARGFHRSNYGPWRRRCR